MIVETTGNLLLDDAQALVNTVNTVGVMGKGIALQFKRAFPANFDAYAQACAEGRVQPGRIYATSLNDDRWVLNFPTKRHWRQPSRLDDIRSGLDDLVRKIVELGISSVALPPLGCGNGRLDWQVVRQLIFEKLDGLYVDVRLYGPGTPYSADLDREISAMEGHYLLGFGDGTGGARADLRLLPAAKGAERHVADDNEFLAVWSRVEQAIFGYEYPDGMELLSTVHFVVHQQRNLDAAEVAGQVAAWNPRKKRLFPPEDVHSAWRHLRTATLLDQ